MAKTNKNVGEDSLKAMTMSWFQFLNTRRTGHNDTSVHLADWICAGNLSAVLAPGFFHSFWQEQLLLTNTSSIRLLDLVIAGCYTMGMKKDDDTTAARLTSFHLAVAQQLDNEETGLLNNPSLEQSNSFNPSVQAAWIWSANMLLENANKTAHTEQLFQLVELYRHETDYQLWDKKRGFYTNMPLVAESTAFTTANNALPMLAQIPDQDRAEEILKWLENHAPPWRSPATAEPGWLGSAAYLLYGALQSYEMHHDAEKLEQYVLQHLTLVEESTQQETLSWLWHNK